MSQLHFEPGIIAKHWYREIMDTHFVGDIACIINQFVECERFNDCLSASCLTFAKDNLMVTRLHFLDSGYGWQNAYGSMVTQPGRIYKWKLKVVQNANGIMIGIINNKKRWDSEFNRFFFKGPDAMAYHGDSGHYFTGCSSDSLKSVPKAEPYGKDDIVGITLDLKEYHLGFSKNDHQFGIIDDFVQQKTSYRLIVGCFNHGSTQQIEIVAFSHF